MTPTSRIATTPAPTWSWVRAFVLAMVPPVGAERYESSLANREGRRVPADVAAALGGDGAAFARIIARYQNLIAARMARFTRDAQMVEELTHDVFVEAYFSLPSYRGCAPLEHWLQRIATRVGYRYWKRKKQFAIASFEERVHGPSAVHPTQTTVVDEEQIAAVLNCLPPRDRLVLTLLYLESRSVAEAADLAGWSQTMVKVQAYRARRKFRKLYSESQPPTSPRRRNNG